MTHQFDPGMLYVVLERQERCSMKAAKVQQRLEDRIKSYAATLKSVTATKWSGGFKKPGSQNPFKR